MTTEPTAPVPRVPPAVRPGAPAGPPPASFRARAEGALRSEGYRMSAQRGALLDVMAHAEGHLDADELYRLARRRAPRISLSTVYRTLHLLTRYDLVDELRLSETHHHYEQRGDDPRHFHLICVDCGGVQEVSGAILAELPEELRRERGFRLTGVRLEVQGHCGRCAVGV